MFYILKYKKMKKLFLLISFLVPMVVFANDYSPFKNVENLGGKILLTFNDKGNKFKVTYKEQEFINSYGQVLKINKGDELVLIEKHTKYFVTATTNSNLHVQLTHSWQGSKTNKFYDIEAKQPDNKMKKREQIFIERHKKHEELLLLFPASPFVIKNGNLVVLKGIKVQNLDEQKPIINLALKSLIGMNIPDGCKVVVQKQKNISIVTFDNNLPEGVRGGDYIAEIKIDTKEMKVLQVLVGS